MARSKPAVMPTTEHGHGFRCPVCKIALEVVKTRKKATGIVYRIRECSVCGRLQRTEERPKGAISDPIPD
jgi:transcription elongation factor Elf1